jgi:hypothetical protein
LRLSPAGALEVFALKTLLGVTVLGYSGQLVEIEAIAQAR